MVYRKSRESSGQAHWEWEASTLVLGDEAEVSTYRKQFSGMLELAHSRYRGSLGFGFAANCFIPADLILANKLHEDDEIEFVAEKNWDPKKDRWGWRAVEIVSHRHAHDDVCEDSYKDSDNADSKDYEDPYKDLDFGDDEAAFKSEKNWSDLGNGKFQKSDQQL